MGVQGAHEESRWQEGREPRVAGGGGQKGWGVRESVSREQVYHLSNGTSERAEASKDILQDNAAKQEEQTHKRSAFT